MAFIQRRTLKDGSVRWKAVVRRKGFPMKTRTCRTRAQAAAWAKRIEVGILDGRAPPNRAEENRTLDDLIDEYVRGVQPKHHALERRKRGTHLKWWSSRLGDVPLLAFRRAMVRDQLRALERGESPSGRKLAPATVNRYLASLRHVFSFAMTELEWISANPLSRMGQREPRGRVRFLEETERDRLLEACRESSEPRLYPLVLLALSTGGRQGELLGLRWRDIDFERQVAVFQHTKNNERRAVPLVGEPLELLREMARVRRIDSDLVFCSARGSIRFPRRAWTEALERAEIDDFRFHDLRHTAASYLAMSGATLAEIAEILGHKTLGVVKRYAHLTDRHTSGVVARMNRRFLPGS